jgi:predicted  nucleic acid-binding Zn-ribbon protein
MASDIKDKVDILLKLQKIELETASVQSLFDDQPRQLSQLETRLDDFKNNIAEAEARLKQLQQSYRSHESDAQIYQSRIEKSNEKLKLVKTNKEYQSFLMEIDELKELQSQIEDKMLEHLVEIDEAEAQIATKQEEFKRLSSETKSEQDKIRDESEKHRKRLARLGIKREEIVAGIEPGLLQTYNTVKKNVGGIAIAIVKDAICQGCNVNIPPQMFNELQRFDKLFYCPHCQRIVYPVTS